MEVPSLSLAKKVDDNGEPVKSYDEESDIHKAITLTVVMPEGGEKEIACRTGETVFNIKKKLHDEHELAWEAKLYLDDKQMLDPLALADFPALADKDAATIVAKLD